MAESVDAGDSKSPGRKVMPVRVRLRVPSFLPPIAALVRRRRLDSTENWHAGRVAIVTGGADGIGYEIASELALRGARVIVGARRLEAPEARFVLEEALGPRIRAMALDVADRASVSKFAEALRSGGLEPSILINNAGISIHQCISDHNDDDWDRVINVNLNGPYRMTRAFLPGMLSNGWGRIINIASTAARTAVADHAAYCASKSGLLGLTRAVALEGAPRGVTCLAVSPTWVETSMLRQSAAIMAASAGREPAVEIAALASANPQNRLVQPGEIARLVSFLCSNAAPALTMEEIQVNAGAWW